MSDKFATWHRARGDRGNYIGEDNRDQVFRALANDGDRDLEELRREALEIVKRQEQTLHAGCPPARVSGLPVDKTST